MRSTQGAALKNLSRKQRKLEGPEAEANLARLHRRFRSVSRRHDRALLLERLYRRARWWALVAAVVAIFCWGLPGYTGWPLATSLKPLAAFAHCMGAEIVGFANATRGNPGYWKHHDQDGNGVACE
jgi:hypothetical protein